MHHVIVRVTATFLLGLVTIAGPVSHELVSQASRIRNATVELAIGTGRNESRETYLFPDVSGLLFGPNGQVLVSVASENQVRVYAADGRFLYAFGRKGRGPGDLDMPCCLSVNADGRLWVVDVGNRRFALYAMSESATRFDRTIELPAAPSGLMNRVEWSPTQNPVLVSSFRDNRSGVFGSIRQQLAMDGTVLVVDTVPMPRIDSLRQYSVTRSVKERNQQGRGTSVISQPFGPRSLRAFGPNGMQALAISSRYTIALHDNAGRKIALLSRQTSPVMLVPAERAKAEESLIAAAKSNRVSRASIKLGVPKVKPPLRAMGFDLDGRLWVQRSTTLGALNEADVFDAKGAFQFTTRWPPDVDLSLWAIRGDRAIGVRTDSDGVLQPVVLRFRA
jgi:hypothetical protein